MLHDLHNVGDTPLVFVTVEHLESANEPLPLPDSVRPRGIEAVQRADASRTPWNGCPAVGDRPLEMMFRVECRDRGGAIVRLCVRESTEPRTVPEQEAIPWG